MTISTQNDLPGAARRWVPILAKYRDASDGRAVFELVATLVPFVALWALAWASLSVSWMLALAIALANGVFLVRLFAIQHDCGHGSYFSNRSVNDWLGRILGVVTMTPYACWRRAHSIHHSACGNLERRGIGDIDTLTVREYRALPRGKQFTYRLYRNPLVLFGLGPSYMFLLQNRVPAGLMRAGKEYWISAMGTNLALAALVGGLLWFGGWPVVLLILLPTTIMAASIGMWLFYVQHQFEETHWDSEPDWQLHDAALHGSSHYDLPPVLRWLTANIGIHHVHHLNSRVPFYRLTEVLGDHQELAEAQILTLRESLACVKFNLWDEDGRRLVSFAQARAL